MRLNASHTQVSPDPQLPIHSPDAKGRLLRRGKGKGALKLAEAGESCQGKSSFFSVEKKFKSCLFYLV